MNIGIQDANPQPIPRRFAPPASVPARAGGGIPFGIPKGGGHGISDFSSPAEYAPHQGHPQEQEGDRQPWAGFGHG